MFSTEQLQSAMKRRGYHEQILPLWRLLFCSMIGSGMNDVSALKEVGIGLDMGLKGTHVVYEVSDMILESSSSTDGDANIHDASTSSGSSRDLSLSTESGCSTGGEVPIAGEVGTSLLGSSIHLTSGTWRSILHPGFVYIFKGDYGEL